jgi:DNA-binding MarR family transcriptional regulator
MSEAEPRTSDRTLPQLGAVLEFMRVIWQLDHALQRTSKRMEASLGVTGPQRLVIRIVGRFPGMPAGQLAKLLHLHPSTLTGILKRLERQGLLRRRADPRDGRRSLFGLTDKGRSFDVDAEGTVEACIARALERTSEEKLHAARELLEAIAWQLEDSVGRPGSAPKRVIDQTADKRRRSGRTPAGT